MEVKDWLGENNTLGIDIWNKKYRYNNESFDEWLDRVSGHDEHIKQMIIDKKFLFAGRILAGRGVADKEECKRTLSNCYVLPPVEDNLESIFDTAKHLARTYSYGGGVGVDISKLAPQGAVVRNSARSSTGAVSFMDLYSLTTGLIGQTHRQGALIITMDISHPDIEKFITIKSDTSKVTKANISVKLTDDFMIAVRNDKTYELYYKRKETGEEFKKQVNARELYALICQQAWDNAEPGVLFWDTVLQNSLMSADTNYKPAGVNPCGEQILPAGGACLLGSINLAAFVTKDKKFDFEEFRVVVFETIRALNEVLDEGQPLHPLEIQRDSAYEWRPMGLGIMGLGDMLIKMEIVYGSQESLELCDKIGRLMAESAITQSIEEAENHGSFPKCDNYSIIASDFFRKHAHPTAGTKVLESGIRNCQLLCLAPCGTISTMLNISGGIEPIFDRYYERRTVTLNEEEKIYKVYTQIVWDYMQEHGISEDDDDQLPEWFITSKEIPYQDRIKMQAVWQEHIDVSISSTVNLPESTTVEDVMNLYMMAWEEGLKGVTIFREGCKRAPILNSTKKNDKKKPPIAFSDDSVTDGEETYSLSWRNDIPLSDKIKYLEYKLKFEDYKDDDEKHAIIRTIEYYKFVDRRIVHPEVDKLDVKKYEYTGSTIKDFYDDMLSKTATDISKKQSRDIIHKTKEKKLSRGEVIKAPANSIGKNRDLVTGCGSLHFQAFFDINTGDVVMTYLSKGSEGGCNSFMIGLSRMISMAGRAGINIYEIADQLHSVPGCTSYIGRKREKKDVSKGTCCPTAIGYALIEMYEEVQEEIALGGVYKGSPLYYKLKAQKELTKSDISFDDIDKLYEAIGSELIIQPQITELEGKNRSVPGVDEIFENAPEEQPVTATECVRKATFDQKMRIMSCDTCGKECEVRPNDLLTAPTEKPKSHEEMERLVAEKTGLCPKCGEPLVFEGGCIDCKACGWSQCD